MNKLLIAVSLTLGISVTAATANDSDECRNFYIDRNYAEVFQYCRNAASAGDPFGQTALGLMYKYGRFVNQNEQEAVRWIALAAAQGYSKAIDILAEVQAEELARHIYNNCVIAKSKNVDVSVLREVRAICKQISLKPTALQRWRWGN